MSEWLSVSNYPELLGDLKKILDRGYILSRDDDANWIMCDVYLFPDDDFYIRGRTLTEVVGLAMKEPRLGG